MTRKRIILVIATLMLMVALLLPACAKQTAPTATTPAPTTPKPTTPGVTTTAPTTVKPTTTATTPAPKPAAEVFKWKCQSSWVPGTAEYFMVAEYSKLIEAASGGRMVITDYPGGALMPTAEHFNGLKSGIVQLINSTCEYWPGMMPEAVIEAGFPGTWRTVQDNEEIFYRMQPKNLITVLREAYSAQNIQLVAVSGNIAHTFWTKKPIKSLADLKDIKMRAPGNSAKVLQTMGVATAFIPHEEVYMAFQLGTIDASCTSGTMYETAKYYEFAKYYHVPYIGAPGHWTYAANMASWKTLPNDLQVLVEKMIKLAYADARMYNDNMATKMEAKAPKLWGTTIVQLPSDVLAAAAKGGLVLLEDAMKANARCKEMGEIIKTYMRSVGYLQD
ncbi:MAG: TRAP transporter substrate-binding protein DctP [Dehalococcoidales bacterium]|nr:TRAP transporter substrate-binding protein DctP [Dehalococcoidales bacterium]